MAESETRTDIFDCMGICYKRQLCFQSLAVKLRQFEKVYIA